MQRESVKYNLDRENWLNYVFIRTMAPVVYSKDIFIVCLYVFSICGESVQLGHYGSISAKSQRTTFPSSCAVY